MSPEPAEPPPIPAATVILLRDGDAGIETLMVRRNAKLAFAGGMWVFPGGRIDTADYPDGVASDDPDTLLAAARRAAVREVHEEARLLVDEQALVWFSHWTPPPVTPKRFATWFFAAPAPLGDVRVDGGEIHDHAWLRPADAIERRDADEIELAPPTWITLHHLREYDSVRDCLGDLGARPIDYFATRFAFRGDDVVAMYEGDAGYDDTDPDREGGRHRLVMSKGGWRYERD